MSCQLISLRDQSCKFLFGSSSIYDAHVRQLQGTDISHMTLTYNANHMLDLPASLARRDETAPVRFLRTEDLGPVISRYRQMLKIALNEPSTYDRFVVIPQREQLTCVIISLIKVM